MIMMEEVVDGTRCFVLSCFFKQSAVPVSRWVA